MSQDEHIHADWANLNKYAAENAALPAPSSKEKRIVFMGNSITEGWQWVGSSFFSNPAYINRGIGGQTTPQMLLRFRHDVIALKPKVVVILAGINDIAENTGPISIETIFGNIVSMVELARANKIRVVVSSVVPANVFPWRQHIKPADKVIALNALLKDYCKERKIVYLDYYSAMVDAEKGLDIKYTEDGVHPTLAGYQVMEPLAVAAIKKALRKKK
jgi:lysophospholipase L1-like esterase